MKGSFPCCAVVCAVGRGYVRVEVGLRGLVCRLLPEGHARYTWISCGQGASQSVACYEERTVDAKGQADGLLFTGGHMCTNVSVDRNESGTLTSAASQTKQTLCQFASPKLVHFHTRPNSTHLHTLSTLTSSFRSRLDSSILSACNVIQCPLEMSSWVV
jgi:hypothetical protein